MEIVLDKIPQQNFPMEWVYTGNFEFWIGGKNPDFVNINGKKCLIEFFGKHWHTKEDEEKRIKHFKKHGFDTLIIWQNELKNEGDLINKISRFTTGE